MPRPQPVACTSHLSVHKFPLLAFSPSSLLCGLIRAVSMKLSMHALAAGIPANWAALRRIGIRTYSWLNWLYPIPF